MARFCYHTRHGHVADPTTFVNIIHHEFELNTDSALLCLLGVIISTGVS